MVVAQRRQVRVGQSRAIAGLDLCAVARVSCGPNEIRDNGAGGRGVELVGISISVIAVPIATRTDGRKDASHAVFRGIS